MWFLRKQWQRLIFLIQNRSQIQYYDVDDFEPEENIRSFGPLWWRLMTYGKADPPLTEPAWAYEVTVPFRKGPGRTLRLWGPHALVVGYWSKVDPLMKTTGTEALGGHVNVLHPSVVRQQDQERSRSSVKSWAEQYEELGLPLPEWLQSEVGQEAD